MIHLSPNEQKLLDLLPKTGETITTKKLMALFYRGKKAPKHGQTYMSVLTAALEAKTSGSSDLGGKVLRSKRSGPNPISVWWEAKKAKIKKAA